ncbi:hypothetical protein Golomagni_07316, partial [Golovinomyces magnicellulatus]
MPPSKPLPFSDEYPSPDEYISDLLKFTQNSDLFQILCGGVHILDFFTSKPGLFYSVLPEEWHEFLLAQDVMRVLDLFIRDDLDTITMNGGRPPESLLEYIRTIRRLSLRREYHSNDSKLPALTPAVAVGMKEKKVHEVKNFADYIDRLSTDISKETGEKVSHFVDFGSGQNYLGRALACEPYNKHVVAVEGRENNVSAAKAFDTQTGLAVKPKILRNKKLWNKILEVRGPAPKDDTAALEAAIKQVVGDDADNYRKIDSKEIKYTLEDGKGFVQYVSGRLEDGDLSEVIAKIDRGEIKKEDAERDFNLMAVSIHSCGNLSHYGIRSLLLNPDIRSVAIVGC